VRLLLDAGADVDRRDPGSGRVPLHAAVTAGAGDPLEVVDALLARRGATD
jgi:ankyrin repeat protein